MMDSMRANNDMPLEDKYEFVGIHSITQRYSPLQVKGLQNKIDCLGELHGLSLVQMVQFNYLRLGIHAGGLKWKDMLTEDPTNSVIRPGRRNLFGGPATYLCPLRAKPHRMTNSAHDHQFGSDPDHPVAKHFPRHLQDMALGGSELQANMFFGQQARHAELYPGRDMDGYTIPKGETVIFMVCLMVVGKTCVGRDHQPNPDKDCQAFTCDDRYRQQVAEVIGLPPGHDATGHKIVGWIELKLKEAKPPPHSCKTI